MIQAKINEQIVVANNCVDRTLNYKCPHCNSELILVKGVFVIDHFRHKIQCPFETEPESETHLISKKWLLANLKKINPLYSIELEKKIGNKITDVFVDMKYKKLCLEVQCSPISYHDFISRNQNYEKYGCEVIWLFSNKSYLKEHHNLRFIAFKLKKAEQCEFERSNKVHYIDCEFKKEHNVILGDITCFWFNQVWNRQTLFFAKNANATSVLSKLQLNTYNWQQKRIEYSKNFAVNA